MTPGDLGDWRIGIERQRAARIARLRDPMGWLTLVGLHWLRPGTQSFGGDPTNDVVLTAEEGEVPAVAGTFEVTKEAVLVRPAPGVALSVDGEPVADGMELADDEQEAPTVLELASLRLVLIRRSHGRRIGIRVRDTAARNLRTFDGLPFFDLDPGWRLTGRLIPADPGATIPVPDVLGDENEEVTPGVVELTIDGQAHRLQALESMPGHVWLVFADRTNGRETYGAGRFLVSGEVQPDGSVEIDFNLAYSPPCVFSPYATCPLPPEGNRLPFRIEAGEQTWHAPAG